MALGLGLPTHQAPTSEPYSLVLQSDQPIKEKKPWGKILANTTLCKDSSKVVILYLCLQIFVSLGELVPEVFVPTGGLGFVQQNPELGMVLLFTSQTGQIEQPS